MSPVSETDQSDQRPQLVISVHTGTKELCKLSTDNMKAFKVCGTLTPDAISGAGAPELDVVVIAEGELPAFRLHDRKLERQLSAHPQRIDPFVNACVNNDKRERVRSVLEAHQSRRRARMRSGCRVGIGFPGHPPSARMASPPSK